MEAAHAAARARLRTRPPRPGGHRWLELGHSSLFYFLHRELGLSKGAAYHRKVAAELLQRFPEVVEPLRDGRLCISSIVELAKVITPENRVDILPRFFHRSKQEAKEVSAEIRPAVAPHRDVVTAPRSEAGQTRPKASLSPAVARPEPLVHPDEPTAVHLDELRPKLLLDEPRPESTAPPATRDGYDVIEPLTADLRRLHVTVSRAFLDKLASARSALSHARPGATTGEILDAALELLLERHAKRRGLVEKPRPACRPSRPDHVPAAVKREVWQRAGGRCEWPVESGGVCGSTLRLEYDHVVPRARGGPSTTPNVRLTCKVHNQVAARNAFGGAWMDQFARKRRESPAERPR